MGNFTVVCLCLVNMPLKPGSTSANNDVAPPIYTAKWEESVGVVQWKVLWSVIASQSLSHDILSFAS